MDKRVFKRARSILAGVKQAEQTVVKLTERKCSWDETDDVNFYRREKRMNERLRRIPDDGMCRDCGRYIGLESKKWVIKRTFVRCKSCDQRIRMFGKGVGGITSAMFVKRGMVLVELRDLGGLKWDVWMLALGLTRNEFWRLCNGGRWVMKGSEPRGGEVIGRKTVYVVDMTILRKCRERLRMGLYPMAVDVLGIDVKTLRRWEENMGEIGSAEEVTVDRERAMAMLRGLAKRGITTDDVIG